MKPVLLILISIVWPVVALLGQTVTSSNLPLIFIDTQGQTIPDEPKIQGNMKIVNNSTGINRVTDTQYEFDGNISIERRGNTSQMAFANYKKKSYALETQTAEGENLNVSLLGLPKENDWVLYGPYSDKSMIRDVLAYHLGNAQGRWSPRTRFCEVFLNNEYRGVYVLTEKIKIDKNRVNIASLKQEDISGDELTGGYIMRIDRIDESKGSWISPFLGRTGSYLVPISYFDPDYADLTPEQKLYIRTYITDFEYALAGEQFKDPQLGYQAYIDVLSFIDYYIMTELSRNLDGYRASLYFHKDKDSKGGKLTASPFWDYNLCFGNANFMEAFNPVGWAFDGIGKGDPYEAVFWWARLTQDPYFNTLLKHRWTDLRGKSFSKNNINAFVDSCAILLKDAQVRNFQKFNILNQNVWPVKYIWGSYDLEVSYLKDWISKRIDWLDAQFDQIVPLFGAGTEDYAGSKSIRPIVFPNPFHSKATFRFLLEKGNTVGLKIQNNQGLVLFETQQQGQPGINELILPGDGLSPNQLLYYSLFVDDLCVGKGKLLFR